MTTSHIDLNHALPAARVPAQQPLWTRRALDALAHKLTHGGPEASLTELVDLAVAARDRGLNGAAVDLLVDPTAPAVVRERAFSIVARRMNA
jgi:DNA polymerase IIIc chi subunit